MLFPALIISACQTCVGVVVFQEVLYQFSVPLFHLVGLFFGFQFVQHDLPVGFLEVIDDETRVKNICAEPWPPRVFGVTQDDGTFTFIVDLEFVCKGIDGAKVQVEAFVCR